jgi:hypothetical protein
MVRCLAVAALIAAVLPPLAASAQIPATFTNLQVLPKDIPRPELVMMMRGIAGGLGVRCTHCHVGPDNLVGMDFASDDKRTKLVARTMLRMVAAINGEYLSKVPAATTAAQQVTCITCHRRSTVPPRPLPDVLLTTLNASGVPAAVEQYRKLRAELGESGLYDFREATLNILATSLRDQKRFAEAIEVLRLNTEMFPKSPAAQVNLGDATLQHGDRAAAETAYKRALGLDPANLAAKRALETLRQK